MSTGPSALRVELGREIAPWLPEVRCARGTVLHLAGYTADLAWANEQDGLDLYYVGNGAHVRTCFQIPSCGPAFDPTRLEAAA